MFPLINKCRRFKRSISDRLEEPLSRKDETRLWQHLAACNDCRKEMAFYQDLKAAAGKMENRTPPAYLWERINVQLEEHPWGEEDDLRSGFWDKFRPGLAGLRSVNLSSALVGFVLLIVLCLFPGLDRIDENSVSPVTAHARELDANLSYLSLYMIANGDMFPDQVREYYLTQLRTLDGKIMMIKDALDRFPENRRIRAQLAMAYAHKLAIYKRIGIGKDDRPTMPEAEYSSRKGDIYD